jgi:hypothetical protein
MHTVDKLVAEVWPNIYPAAFAREHVNQLDARCGQGRVRRRRWIGRCRRPFRSSIGERERDCAVVGMIGGEDLSLPELSEVLECPTR